jgi:hypothetical protein
VNVAKEIPDVVQTGMNRLIALHQGGASAAALRAAQFDLGLAWVWFPNTRVGSASIANCKT